MYRVVSYPKSSSNHNFTNTYVTDRSVVSYPKSSSNHNSKRYRRSVWDVVSYPKSSSNHNALTHSLSCIKVVSYPKSSSNHNCLSLLFKTGLVVSYPKSSSNHNLCRIKACLSLCYVMHLANRKWNEDVPFSANVLKKLQLYGLLLDFLLCLAPNIYNIGVLLVSNG